VVKEGSYQGLIDNLAKRNIKGVYCADCALARDYILNIIPLGCSVGMSGSLSLEDIGIIQRLEERGNKVFNQYKSGLKREEAIALRRLGSGADYYLTGVNAVSSAGELVFFSAYGERISGIACAKKVIVACGVNKITSNLEAALERTRERVAPLNCRRLNWASACLDSGECRKEICFSPGYKRMCSQVFIIESEISLGRLELVLIGKELGL